jgi:hypothetical protein
MSVLIYNGISLVPIRTNFVQRDVQMSADGTDYLYTVFTINVGCVYNPGQTSYAPSPLGPVGNVRVFPAVTDTAIRHYLMQPRMYLLYSDTDVFNDPNHPPILAIYPSGVGNFAIDANNGPTPLNCVVRRIHGNRLFYVDFTIRASIIECPVVSPAFLVPIASSRYARTEQIDKQYRSTLTTSGITFFRSNQLVAIQNNADAFRGYLIPPPILGYQRINVSVNLDPSGLILNWATTDVEQFIDLGNLTIGGSAASLGIVEMGLDYTAGVGPIPGGNVAKPLTDLSVTVSAVCMRAADGLSVVSFMLRVIFDKLAAIIDNTTLVAASVSEDVFNNVFVLDYKYIYWTDKSLKIEDLVAPVNATVGVPIASLPYQGGANPWPPFSQGTRTDTDIQLAAANLATACYTSVFNQDPTGQIQPTDFDVAPQQFSNPPLQVNVFTGSLGPEDDLRQLYYQVNRSIGNPLQTGYIRYDLWGHRIGSEGNAHVPIAGPVSARQPPNSQSPNSQSLNSQNPNSQNPKPTSAVLNLVNPIARYIVYFVIERIQSVPEIPDPTVINSLGIYVLLSTKISPVHCGLFADGTSTKFSVSGEYVYACLVPVAASPTAIHEFPFLLPNNVIGQLGDDLHSILDEDYVQNLDV